MAYTAPNDLFTSEEAILSLASSIADEDRTNLGNGTINGALDVLADALAERNVEVPPMNAGAILALAQYVSGGGGGGVDVGKLIYVISDAQEPFVGNHYLDFGKPKGSLGVGGSTVAANCFVPNVAEGVDFTATLVDGVGFYACTYSVDSDGIPDTITAVEELSLSTTTSGGVSTFRIPTLGENQMLFIPMRNSM